MKPVLHSIRRHRQPLASQYPGMKPSGANRKRSRDHMNRYSSPVSTVPILGDARSPEYALPNIHGGG
ncbi:hypothetical protein BU25DRAFT_161361 [Macroventuria anomochaeta]|uniref:Uncharacterized protein n=1 Tax=Macroventuria anomochaeta TaxID=301207 RepID=A0ACB6RR39_9PLEO|nr:uncharacterized protein BU25DRAFT_161361 [Macroventuria anomochaeta]KAF2624440.1 hypothetical protein BU25DRAFT_161361 [Macroventuria anomochaeta]